MGGMPREELKAKRGWDRRVQEAAGREVGGGRRMWAGVSHPQLVPEYLPDCFVERHIVARLHLLQQHPASAALQHTCRWLWGGRVL